MRTSVASLSGVRTLVAARRDRRRLRPVAADSHERVGEDRLARRDRRETGHVDDRSRRAADATVLGLDARAAGAVVDVEHVAHDSGRARWW